MNQHELTRLAASMVSGPRDPDLYIRALHAAAVARRGLELLQEIAEMVDGEEAPLRLVADSAQAAALRPGDRLLDRNGDEARTDLLDEAGEGVRFALASGSANDMAVLLGGMTDPGLREKAAASIAEFLEALPSGDVSRVKELVARWPVQRVDTSLLTRLARAMLPEVEGGRSDLLRFAGDRLRDAAALLKEGKDLLHEVAGLLPSPSESRSPLAAADLRSYTPGARVTLGDVSVPTDPLELLGSEVGAIVASEAAKLDELDRLLTTLTRGLEKDGRPVGALRAYLTSETAPELARALGLPATETGSGTAPSPPFPTGRTNLGRLRRALERVPQHCPAIEAAWEVLAAKKASFARRWAAGVHLLRMTRELVRTDPAKAAAWAARVGTAAEGLAAPGGFEGRMADFLGNLASAHIGNSLRVQGHLLVAERFFLPWEEDDQLGLRAEYLGLKANLRRAERKFREALHLLEEADRIARRGDFPGSHDVTGRVRITQARIFIMLCDFDTASALLRSALGLRVSLLPEEAVILRDKLSPHVRWIVLQNLADSLSKAGELGAAEGLLGEIEALAEALGLSETDLLRTRWVRARIEVRKAWHAGADNLQAVRERLIELGLAFDAALASLELAEWHAEEITGAETDEEHLAAIRELARESAEFFSGQDVGPEAVAALVLFQHVASFSVPSASAFRKIEQLLRQAALS